MNSSRCSGILMPIFSLPSKYGIGTMGKTAYDFIDFLHASRQTYWQVLPAGPTSYGDSPYQSFSSFAGNPYFIDLDMLIEDGLIGAGDVAACDWGSDETKVDYSKIYESRFKILAKAAQVGTVRDKAAFDAFKEKHAAWLDNYTLFMALKRHFEMKAWTQWPDEDVRLHDEAACVRYRELLSEDVELFSYIQFLFYTQWMKLKAYAAEKHISIIGDVPIYVAMDSCDVWSEPQWFQLDKKNVPLAVAGVPPDAFSEDGQLWGNPLYDWDRMKEDGFGWWIRRIDGAFRLFDVIRFDHFRGLESYWSVPVTAKSAKEGKWVKGPGQILVKNVLTGWFYGHDFIAEDLGYLTPEVKQLLADSGFPGMKILEFGFENGGSANYQTHEFPVNSVCYIGTHDNHTALGWEESFPAEDVALAREYLGIAKDEPFNWGMIREGMRSVSSLFITQMQDYLDLGSDARINAPGTASGNWTWRMKAGAADKTLAEKICHITKLYGRDNAALVAEEAAAKAAAEAALKAVKEAEEAAEKAAGKADAAIAEKSVAKASEEISGEPEHGDMA